MNFPNQSFLGKYFKNVEGISPTDFRRNMPRWMGEGFVMNSVGKLLFVEETEMNIKARFAL